LRLGKVFKLAQGSEVLENFEEMIWSSHCAKAVRLGRLIGLLVFCGHWLACVLVSLGQDSLIVYLERVHQEGEFTHFRIYVAALYWSMMTIATVGYGDISMITDRERMFAVVAMMIGGSVYGYLIGSLTSVVADSDLNNRAFKDRMDLVTSWLDFHDELPKPLRRRIWRHFRDHLSKKTAVEDSIVMNDLPSTLRHHLSTFLLHDDVRHNMLFADLPSSELPQLVMIVEHANVASEETICFAGERGSAMYIVTKGTAMITHTIVDEDGKEQPSKPAQLTAGDSFGEEFLLGLCWQYKYSVVSETKMAMLKIPAEHFLERFGARPDLMQHMKGNFEQCERGGVFKPTQTGCSSILEGGALGIAPSFPDAVFATLSEMLHKIDTLAGQDSEARTGVPQGDTGAMLAPQWTAPRMPDKGEFQYQAISMPSTEQGLV